MRFVRFILSSCCWAVLLSGAAAFAVAAPSTQQWRFAVTINDRPVGFHEFWLESTPQGVRVVSSADFDLKLLFVSVFRYRHHNTEEWQADCLSRIESSTRMNRQDFAVRGQQGQGGFMVERRGEADASARSVTLPACVKSFAYWNPDILTESQLLNAQTGELQRVDVSDLGTDTLEVNDRTIEARRYRLQLEASFIDVWYDATLSTWLGLESITPDGAEVRYRRVPSPGAPGRA